jgi:hypothetical protein
MAIRRYERLEVDLDHSSKPVFVKVSKPLREKPFAAERALLRELGLRSD